MLSRDTWNAAGGKYSPVRGSRRDKPTKEESEGFRFATLDEIEEILDRKMTVDDFALAPINWHKQSGVVFDKIGIEGQKKLAEKWLQWQGEEGFPKGTINIDTRKEITYNTPEEYMEDEQVKLAMNLIGDFYKVMDLLGAEFSRGY